MLLLILDSLGSTELLFILVMALIFFGPRKLPQISRSLGKSLAEFRRASDEFKRTWEREVAFESSQSETSLDRAELTEHNSIIDTEARVQTVHPAAEAVPVEQTAHIETSSTANVQERTSEDSQSTDREDISEPLRKRDWL